MSCHVGSIGKYDVRVIKLIQRGRIVLNKKTGAAYSGLTGNPVGSVKRGRKGQTPYIKVSLPIGKRLPSGKRKYEWFPLHRAMALAHYGLPPEGCDRVNHIDGDGTNNKLKNLEWCSAKQNTQHAIALGTIAQNGEDNQCALLTEKIVRRILLSPKSEAELALRYHVGWKTIQTIRLGKNWPHIYDAVKNSKKFKRLCAERACGRKSGPNLKPAQIKRIYKSKDSVEALAVEYGKGCQVIANIKACRVHAHITKGLKRG